MPPSLLSLAKTGVKTALAAKETACAVLHPVQWLKDKLVEALALALLAALKATVGPELAAKAIDRLSLEGKTLPCSLSVPVPERVRQYLDADGLLLAQDVANEALAGPLELLGYRLGRLQVAFIEETGKLDVTFEVGLMPLKPSLTAPGTLALEAPAADKAATLVPSGTSVSPASS